MEGVDEKLPVGWVKVKSRSRPDKSYFHNPRKKISLWKLEDLKKFIQKESTEDTGSKVTSGEHPERHLSSTPKKSQPGISWQSKTIKKNIARDRMTKLKNVFMEETERESEVSKPKKNKNVGETMPATVTKNIASDRMKRLNIQLKREVKGFNSDKNITGRALHDVHKDVNDEIRNDEKIPTKVQKKNGKSIKEIIAPERKCEDVELMDISYEEPPQALPEYEVMDWEEIPEQKIIEEVQKIRTAEIANMTASLFLSQKSHDIKSEFFIVVDTNVLLSNLDFLREIKGKMFKGRLNGHLSKKISI